MHKLKDGSIIEDGWTEKSWYAFQEKLSHLTLDELFALATVTGLFFDGPYDKLRKIDFLGALDEVDRKELEKVYQILIKNRSKKRNQEK